MSQLKHRRGKRSEMWTAGKVRKKGEGGEGRRENMDVGTRTIEGHDKGK